MKIVIAAATGGVGRLSTEQARAAGHDVTALARNPEGFSEQVRTAQIDLSAPDKGALEFAMAGADAVLSCLGPRSRKEPGIAFEGTRVLVDAAANAGVRHFSMISASPVGTTASPRRPTPPSVDPGDDFVTGRIATPIIRLFFGGVYTALAEAEDYVLTAGIAWTIVRPPRLTDGSAGDSYRTSTVENIRGGRKVSRANVAACLLRSASEPEMRNQIVRISD